MSNRCRIRRHRSKDDKARSFGLKSPMCHDQKRHSSRTEKCNEAQVDHEISSRTQEDLVQMVLKQEAVDRSTSPLSTMMAVLQSS